MPLERQMVVKAYTVYMLYTELQHVALGLIAVAAQMSCLEFP